MRYLIRAYLDDYNLINVEVDKSFCDGKSSSFYLLQQDKIVELKVCGYNEHKNFNCYSLICPELVIGQQYQIMAVNSYRTPLIYRYIVKTERFNEEFYYDGRLGSYINNGQTEFVLWAPTTSQAFLQLPDQLVKMQREEKGVFRATIDGELEGCPYSYLLKVNGEVVETLDPYSKAALANSSQSVVTKQNPLKPAQLPKETSNTIYELSVRDFTEEGTFKALANKVDYLEYLGVSHVQLMPVNDFGSVDEYHKDIYYNWGYDPVLYQSLEGSYSSDPSNPLIVLKDFGYLIETLHSHNIRVNLDVVFNHVYSAENGCFNATVPYYYFRYENNGKLADGSFCGNEFASEMPMARKHIVDTLMYYVNNFDIDGFRFDLMGLLDSQCLLEAYQKISNIKKDIMFYGEGWNMRAALAETRLANMNNSASIPFVGFFNDDFRNDILGNAFEKSDRGYGLGNIWKVNAGASSMTSKRFNSPWRSVNYVECHDNRTAYDKVIAATGSEPNKVIARAKMLLAFVLLSNGFALIGEGQEFCRSKNGHDNSYNLPDSLNKIKEADKLAHKDVIEYAHQLISIRKEYQLMGKEVEVRVDKGVLLIKNGDLDIVLNPTDEQYLYHLEKPTLEVISGTTNSDLCVVKPISACAFRRV